MAELFNNLLAQASDLAGQILALVLPLLATALTAWLLAAVKSKLAHVKSEYGSDPGYWLDAAATMAVNAAQQTLEDNGEKLKYATKLADEYLRMRGVVVPIGVIVGKIESAVFEELHTFTTETETTLT